LLLLCIALASGVTCMRPARQRAEFDGEVGKATSEHWSVRVKHGHAAVTLLNQDEVSLWSSVPCFDFELEKQDGGAGAISVTIENHMPGAELGVTPDSAAAVGEPERLLDTQSAWRVELGDAGAVTLSVAAPDCAAPDGFEFALLSDVQEAIGGFHEMLARLNQEPDVRFVIGAGDLTSDGTREELVRFQEELRALRVPYYATLGNHELGEDPPPYYAFFGRGNYSFQFKDVRFTLLESASATIDPLVYGWLDAWLTQGRRQTHVVAMHIPPLDPSGTRHGAFASKNEAAKLLNSLALNGVDVTLYGHIHTYVRFENAGIDAHIAGGGGAIPNHGDGIGRHYLVLRAHPTRGIEHTRVVEVDSDWAY